MLEFLKPVDTKIFTDYLNVVKNPMDLRTMREKLQARFVIVSYDSHKTNVTFIIGIFSV